MVSRDQPDLREQQELLEFKDQLVAPEQRELLEQMDQQGPLEVPESLAPQDQQGQLAPQEGMGPQVPQEIQAVADRRAALASPAFKDQREQPVLPVPVGQMGQQAVLAQQEQPV